MEPKPAITFEVNLLACRGTLLSQAEAENLARTRTIFISTGLRGDDNILGKHGDQFTLYGAQALYFKELIQSGAILNVKVVEASNQASAPDPTPVLSGDGILSGSAITFVISLVSSAGGIQSSGTAIVSKTTTHLMTGGANADSSAVVSYQPGVGGSIGGSNSSGSAIIYLAATQSVTGGSLGNGQPPVSVVTATASSGGILATSSATVFQQHSNISTGGLNGGGSALDTLTATSGSFFSDRTSSSFWRA